MDNKDPISKYSRVLSLGSWLSVPGNSPLKTRRISSADTWCGKIPMQTVWQNCLSFTQHYLQSISQVKLFCY